MENSENNLDAKRAFAAIYADSPADFNKIATQAIKDRVKEKIKAMRGEIRDEVAAKFIGTEKPAETPAPVTEPTAAVKS